MIALRVAARQVPSGICTLLLVLVIQPALVAARPARTASPGGNNPPQAIIGPNQTIGVHPNVPAVATLDGSKSYDPEADPLTYEWRDQNGVVIGTGPIVQVGIAVPGTYVYLLTVTDTYTDGSGTTKHHSASAATTVVVAVDVVPPAVNAPDITVRITDPGSATVNKSTPLSDYMLSGATITAVDDVDPRPHLVQVSANHAKVTDSTVFPEGDTPVVAYYADQAGNVGSSAATVHVVDLQDNDIFILTGEGNCFLSPCNDVVQRIRNGAIEDFCQLPGGSTSSYAFTGGLLLDSSGRVVGLRSESNNAGFSGVDVFRCLAKGAPPQPLAFIRHNGPLPPGYPEPFPDLSAVTGGGLTLASVREVVIDDNQNHGLPFIVNEDAYSLNLHLASSAPTNVSKTYHVKQDFWEDGPDLGSLTDGNQPASLYFDSGTTYVTSGPGGGAGSQCLGRVKVPLTVHATGQVSGVSFDLRLNLFSSSGEFCGLILNDLTIPDMVMCPNPPHSPPVSNPAPFDGNGFTVMDSFQQVFFDEFNGHGLTLTSGSGAAGSGILTDFSTLPLDDPGSKDNFFGNSLADCAIEEQVRFTPLLPHAGFVSSPITPTSQGLLTMVPNVNLFAGSSVVELTSGMPRIIVNGGLGPPGTIAAWPIKVSAGIATTVLIRVDSPVDVLLTDPNGKRLGVLNGAPVNEFGNDAADTGADTHPRFYAINHPVPGDYTVDSVGTDTGPYTVHVYTVDTSKPFGRHILSSGTAAPGSLSRQDFTLDAGGGISFTNHLPTADAGPDQTVTADANGTAMVNLDGSASSDPDGDTLAFTWAGPFGLVTGAWPQVGLPVGDSVLQLTVDDGKGASASANVTITVSAPTGTGPTTPVVTPPADISILATEGGGARGAASAALAAFLAGGTATDSSDPMPTRLAPQAGGVNVDNTTLFPVGTTAVTFRFQNASGGIGTAKANATVSLGQLVVTPANSYRLYGDSNPAFPGTIVGLQTGDNITATYSSMATQASPAGAYAIIATLSDPDNRLGKYAVTLNEGTLTVDPAPLSIAANNALRPYGADNPSFAGTITGLRNADPISATFGTWAGPASPVGSYAIVPTVVDPSSRLGNYVWSLSNGTLIVRPETTSLAVTLAPPSIVVGQSAAVTVALTAADMVIPIDPSVLAPITITSTVMSDILANNGVCTPLPSANPGQASCTVAVTSVAPGGRTLSARFPATSALAASSGTADLIVTDVPVANQPPLCQAAQAQPSVLWPPDRRFRPVRIDGVIDPDGDPVSLHVTRVMQDEPVRGHEGRLDRERGDAGDDDRGWGDGAPDAIIAAGGGLLLRAEREVPGNGRVYHVHFEAADGRGATCSGTVLVGVPLDPRPGGAAVDDGERFDSTRGWRDSRSARP